MVHFDVFQCSVFTYYTKLLFYENGHFSSVNSLKINHLNSPMFNFAFHEMRKYFKMLSGREEFSHENKNLQSAAKQPESKYANNSFH